MRAVRELHEDDAQVARHREQHLAEAFRLRFFAALELDLVELGDGVDQLGDVAAELRGELVLRRRRVFDDVVKDRRDDGVGVEPQIREDRGGGYGMGDVGLAGEALLTLVGRSAELGGFADARDLLGRQVGLDGAQQLLETRSASSAGKQSQERRRIVHGQGGAG